MYGVAVRPSWRPEFQFFEAMSCEVSIGLDFGTPWRVGVVGGGWED